MSVVYTVGLNHRTAPLELRELLAMSADAIVGGLRHLRRQCHVREAAILSTCNRTEIYCLSDSSSVAPKKVAGWLDDVAAGRAGKHLYCYQSREAATHLFRVASGLDSQLLGETEIAAQVKQYGRLARDSGAAGVVINRLMERALAAAKEVRSSTDISRHSLSYPVLAARAAGSIFPDLRDAAVLFVGGGDMTRAGAPVFAARGAGRLAITARTLAPLEKTAEKCGAELFPISRLTEILALFDIVITATGSQVPIIGKGAVESALTRRRDKPMMFADLAVPRDLEEEIKALPNVFVYHLDQFGEMAEIGMEERRTAAVMAEKIIERHVDDFQGWLRARANVEDVRRLRADAADICERETAAAVARLNAGAAAEEVVRDVTRRLTGKLMHQPTVRLLRREE